MAATDIKGLDKLRKRFLDIIPDETRKLVSAAMEDSATQIMGAAVSRVPIDKGTLANTIRRTNTRIDKKGRMYVAVIAGDETTKVKTPGAKEPYNVARLVEFGTEDTDPQPFLLPAYRAAKNRTTRLINKAVKAAIMKGGD